MTFTTKQIYAAAVLAVAVLLFAAGNSLYSEWKFARLEREIHASIERADRAENIAAELEKRAGAFREKAEYIERNLLQIQEIARSQDENIKKIATAANDARTDVNRARGIRTIAATADELCAKLTELGHPCD